MNMDKYVGIWVSRDGVPGRRQGGSNNRRGAGVCRDVSRMPINIIP
jgi:hypothetical protein